MTINTDSAIAKEGFSANFTVLDRTVPEGELAQYGGKRNPLIEL